VPATRKILFVCTANLQRSPTAEKLFQGWNGEWEARSAGITPEPGCRTLTQELIDWADVIIAMERLHGSYMNAHFRGCSEKTNILGIPDIYFQNDPELVSELLKKVPPILDKHRMAESVRNSRPRSVWKDSK